MKSRVLATIFLVGGMLMLAPATLLLWAVAGGATVSFANPGFAIFYAFLTLSGLVTVLRSVLVLLGRRS